MRQSGASGTSFCNRSALTIKCVPRLFSASAWTSSMTRNRRCPSAGSQEFWLSKIAKLSGVVTRICGGLRRCAARSFVVVSPVRMPTRTSSKPSCASGPRMFFCKS
jgi:hypothetical protein